MRTIEQLFSEHVASKSTTYLELQECRAEFMAGAAAMASLFAPANIEAQSRATGGDGGPQWQPRGGDQGAFDTGNLGPWDPRSFNRRCVHGKLPTEECTTCAGTPMSVEPAPGFDANGSPVA